MPMNERGRCSISLSKYGGFWTSLRSKVGDHSKLMAVVKADAYGCGALKMSAYLEEESLVDYLGVATCKEALSLRKSGSRLPILTFCEPDFDTLSQCVENGIEMSVWSHKTVQDLAQFSTETPIKLHLNVNTGMNRVGCELNELDGCISFINQTPHLELSGIYTHFACAGQSRSETLSQLNRFKHAVASVRLPKGCCVHAANSDATAAYPEAYLDMVRVGIESYMECVTLEAKVLQVRTIKPGDGVGYDHQFVAQKTTRIATVSMGYADGIPRRFNGNVLIQGKSYPVVGYVCMDMCMVDVGHAEIRPGDTVVFVGEQQGASIPLATFAESSGRIPYESLCAIGNRIERVYR